MSCARTYSFVTLSMTAETASSKSFFIQNSSMAVHVRFQICDWFWIPHQKLHGVCFLDFLKSPKMGSLGEFLSLFFPGFFRSTAWAPWQRCHRLPCLAAVSTVAKLLTLKRNIFHKHEKNHLFHFITSQDMRAALLFLSLTTPSLLLPLHVLMECPSWCQAGEIVLERLWKGYRDDV